MIPASVSIVERILDFIRPLFDNWGYLIVFGFAFLERSFLVGLVVPGNAVVLLGGMYAGLGDLNISLVILFAFVGSLAGDNLGYLLGRKVGRPLVERHGDFMRLKERVLYVEKYFQKHGGATVLVARFVTFLGALACPVAGMSRMGYKRFFQFELIGSVIWSAGFGLLGYFFGRGYDTIMKVFNYIGNTLLILILAAALAAYLVLRVREHRQLETELDEIAVEEGDEGESGAGGSND